VIWPAGFDENQLFDIRHGTRDLGIILGRDNGPGIVGIAPGATFRGCVSSDAIAVASPEPAAIKTDLVNAVLGAWHRRQPSRLWRCSHCHRTESSRRAMVGRTALPVQRVLVEAGEADTNEANLRGESAGTWSRPLSAAASAIRT